MDYSNGQAVLLTSAYSSAATESAEPTARTDFDLRKFDALPTRDVPIDTLSPGVALRQDGTDAAHIQLLVDAAGWADLPPILVQMDGYRIIDGLHRLAAARLRGDDTIKARFLDCSDSEALVIAMSANGSHGLPLSKADRVSGAQRVLSSHPDWSDRAIAGITGLSAKTIASLRVRSVEAVPVDGKRIGRDGRRRPVDAAEGRRRAAEYIAAHPNAPLRQVATETDVSLGTVHDVRARLRRGEGPERDGGRIAAQPQAPQPVRAALPVSRADESTRLVAAPPGGTRTPLRVARTTDVTPHRRNHADAAPSWAAVAAKMAGDPAIRYTTGGREFLRWMQRHATNPADEWREVVDAIPPHWLGVVAPIAENVAREWIQLAERLKAKQESVS
jgi:ParB-like chromosome segregation protein Spo0J